MKYFKSESFQCAACLWVMEKSMDFHDNLHYVIKYFCRNPQCSDYGKSFEYFPKTRNDERLFEGS